MKKPALFITAGIIVLSVSGYFLYEKFLQPKRLTPWQVVPSSAVAVYEASSCDECVEPVKKSSLWEIIMRAALYNKQQDSIRNIVDLVTQQRTGALASLHVTKKDDFDFIFYLPVHDETEATLLMATLDDWKSKTGIRYSERVYNGTTIHEMNTGTAVFSWAFLKNVWAASFTPFLLEDVVRVFSEGNTGGFQRTISGVYQMPKLKNDAGNLYVHLRNFSEWLSVFSPGTKMDLIQHFGKSAVLDIKAAEKNLVLNGFSIEDPQQASVLSVFNGQFPTSFDLKQYVSNRTVVLATYGISEGEDFGSKLREYPGRPASVDDSLRRISENYKIDISGLYEAIDNEVAICYVESPGQNLSRVLMVEAENAEQWLQPFNSMAARLSTDTIFFEPFSGYEIRELPLYRFPEKLFAPLINGFDQCYYTSFGNTVFIGENLEQLKDFLEDIDGEETWGKSVAQNRFLESTLLESNVSLYVNTPRIWNILARTLNEKWSRFLQDNQPLLSSVGMGAIQFSHLNESFYTNVAWQLEQVDAPLADAPTKSETTITEFQSPIASRPWPVRSHMDKSTEVFLQDSSNQVHLVSRNGKVLWSMSMNSPIAGDVFQVDFFKNGKLQYFFATEGQLHIIDRLGNYVSPFPVSVKAKNIEHISLVDYDHSKNYRFLIADRSGKLWIYDKNGVNLEGWQPRDVQATLFAPPNHHRIRGKDYMIAIGSDGTAHLMNRRGEYLKGFPLKLDARPTGDYFLEKGSRVDNTYFVVVSREGFKIRFALDGKIRSRETLLKSSVTARFELVSEQQGKGYVIVRQESNGLSILNEEGREILTNRYVGLNNATVRYYDLGAGEIYYMVTDEVQDLTYLYDSRGNLQVSPPLEAFSGDLTQSKRGKVDVYLTYHRSLVVKPVF